MKDTTPVQYGIRLLEKALKGRDIPEIAIHDEPPARPGRFNDQGFRLRAGGGSVRVGAASPAGALYALQELAQAIREEGFDPFAKATLEREEAPAMRYRGHQLGLQRPVPFYDDHKVYDWPITEEHFPWFYDREHLLALLDRLFAQRCNVLYFWSGHPFASFLQLDDYPEMAEVDAEQMRQNQEQLRWLCAEAEKRGIWVVFKFYNIHMPDPLAKARGWSIMAAEAHPEICEYTRKVLAAFVRTFPNIGLMACMGEVLKPADQGKWLCDVILPGILEGLGEDVREYPPVIIRAHHINLEEHLPPAQKIYPNLVTMMKHNNESFVATRPDPGNTVLARLSGCHIVNVHLMANLEPFAWGSPRFIRRAAGQMFKAEASGVHVYPLRYWDWPNSARNEPLGDQLHEHFLWWNAWGRYAWEPDRDEAEENAYWTAKLAAHHKISESDARAFLDAQQEVGPVLPQIAGQFMITSGNGQCMNLGQFIVPLFFSRQQFQDSPEYSMPQMGGFPLIGERMWAPSPVNRMERMVAKCDRALERLGSADGDSPVLELQRKEIEAMRLLARYYEVKARACAEFFHVYFGVPEASEQSAIGHLEESVEIYRELASLTKALFRDASSLYHYRRMPLPVKEGYLDWEDCLPAFEAELERAREGGIETLIRDAREKAKPSMEWNAAALNTDEV